VKTFKYLIAIGLISAFCGLYGYWFFATMQPFTAKEIPVLVTPEPAVQIEEEEGPDLTYFEARQLERFNVLILGIDNWDNKVSRTDLMMLVNVNTQNKQVNVISIPRDTRVEIPDVGYTKINHAHVIGEIKGGNKAGTEMALQAVSNLLQTPIHYYAKIDIEGFKNFIDQIGGLDIELTQSVKLSHLGVTLPAQKQNIDGNLAFELVRERYSLPDGDFGRQRNQYLVLKALVFKLLKPEYLSRLPELITMARNEVVDTNFNDTELICLAWLFKGTDKESINYMQIPGRSEYFYDPLVKVNLYYWVPDMEKIKEISDKYLNQ